MSTVNEWIKSKAKKSTEPFTSDNDEEFNRIEYFFKGRIPYTMAKQIIPIETCTETARETLRILPRRYKSDPYIVIYSSVTYNK